MLSPPTKSCGAIKCSQNGIESCRTIGKARFYWPVMELLSDYGRTPDHGVGRNPPCILYQLGYPGPKTTISRSSPLAEIQNNQSLISASKAYNLQLLNPHNVPLEELLRSWTSCLVWCHAHRQGDSCQIAPCLLVHFPGAL